MPQQEPDAEHFRAKGLRCRARSPAIPYLYDNTEIPLVSVLMMGTRMRFVANLAISEDCLVGGENSAKGLASATCVLMNNSWGEVIM